MERITRNFSSDGRYPPSLFVTVIWLGYWKLFDLILADISIVDNGFDGNGADTTF